jgi:uncharacterized membrane protein
VGSEFVSTTRIPVDANAGEDARAPSEEGLHTGQRCEGSGILQKHLPIAISDLRLADMLLNISRFLQLLATGLYTGILFGDRIGVSHVRTKLEPAQFVLFQQGVHSRFGILMPLLIGVSLLAGLISLALLRRYYKSPVFIFTLISTLCTLGVIVLTRLINVPINDLLMTWQVSAPPQNVAQLWAPWEGSHSIRTVIAVLGFVSLAYAFVSPMTAKSETHSL